MTPDRSIAVRSAMLWSRLAWFEILSKYRKTFLGPFWLTLSMGITIGFLGVFYSKILGQDLKTFIPYLAVGLVVWGFLSSMVQEAPQVFTSNRYIILNMPVRVENIVLRMVVRTFFVMLHNAVILLPIGVFFPFEVRPAMLLAFPGLFFALLFCYSLALIFGLAGARFRDVGPTVSTLMGMLFLVTPIIWYPSQMQNIQFLVDFNPFYHLIEAVRSPLIPGEVNVRSLGISGLMAIALFVFSFFALKRYRYRLVFWI